MSLPFLFSLFTFRLSLFVVLFGLLLAITPDLDPNTDMKIYIFPDRIPFAPVGVERERSQGDEGQMTDSAPELKTYIQVKERGG
ncbi:MAG: hypothetical protein J3R72DRAFT_435185, partial [Linnemannia gamsii]